MRFSSKNYLVLTSLSFPFLFISPFSFHLSEVSAYYQNTPFGGFITSQKYTFRRLSPNDLCLFLSDTNKILKRLENSLHKFHRCVSAWLTMSLCETSGFTEGSPSFTPDVAITQQLFCFNTKEGLNTTSSQDCGPQTCELQK